MNKKNVILLMICIVCIAMMLSFMIWRLNRSRETEGFESIKGINSIGLSEESGVKVYTYDDDKKNMYNFKIRNRTTIDGSDVLSVFYLKYSDNDGKIYYQDFDKNTDDKWLTFNNEVEIDLGDKIRNIIQYEYIDSGSLKDSILVAHDKKLTLCNPKKVGQGKIYNEEQKEYNGHVNDTKKRKFIFDDVDDIHDYNILKLYNFTLSSNNTLNLHVMYEHNINEPSKMNIKKYRKIYILSFGINQATFDFGVGPEITLDTWNKYQKMSFDATDWGGNSLTEYNGGFITDLTLNNEHQHMLIYNDYKYKEEENDNGKTERKRYTDKFSITIGEKLIVNQFKKTKDYNLLESMIKGGTILGIASFNNSIYMVGTFDRKHSNDVNNNDDPNRMEMVKFKVSGDEIRIESIVSLPSVFQKSGNYKTKGPDLNNLLILDNQLIMNHDNKLLVLVDLSKDPNFIIKARRGKKSINTIYRTSESFKIILDGSEKSVINWIQGDTSKDDIRVRFTLKEDDMKGKKTILIYGVSIQHDGDTLIKRFTVDNIDNTASFGFYGNEDNVLSVDSKNKPFYFMFVTPYKYTFPETKTETKTSYEIQLIFNIKDLGDINGNTVLKDGKIKQDKSIKPTFIVYYNIFEDGTIHSNDPSSMNKCEILKTYKDEINKANTDPSITLNENQLYNYSNTCKERYQRVQEELNKVDLNNAPVKKIQYFIDELRKTHTKCKELALPLQVIGDDVIKKKIYEDINETGDLTLINDINNKIETLKIKEKAQKKVNVSFLNGFKDAFKFALDTIKKDIKDVDFKNENNKLVKLSNNIRAIKNKRLINSNEVTCDNTDTHMKLDSWNDNLLLYKDYNEIYSEKIKKMMSNQNNSSSSSSS